MKYVINKKYEICKYLSNAELHWINSGQFTSTWVNSFLVNTFDVLSGSKNTWQSTIQ